MIRKWVELTSRKETGEVLALFRILTGFGLLWNVGGSIRVLEVIWLDHRYGGYRHLGSGSWLIELLGNSPAVVWSLAIAALIFGAMLVIGLGGRWTALLGMQAMFALSMINGHTKGSYDALLCNALWLLFLAEPTATWSLDARMRGSWESDREVSTFPRYLAVVQLVVV